MKRGIVIGKFYPFHSGHAYLIETARQQSDQLTVLVCDRSDQVFTGAERASWIKESFPEIEVRVMRDIFDDDNSKRWAEYTIAFLGYQPDVVFTSEDYGEGYAHYLGAKHILVDRERLTIPMSGTLARKNPFTQWHRLSAAVRARLVRRVVIMGAESTGTTTIARALAEQLQTVWVPEFGRLYSEGKQPSQTEWKTEEFVFIAEEQNRMEDYYARLANKILICDTGSTDRTKEIIREFTAEVYDFPWKNDFSAARNFISEKVSTDYWMWLDADDMITQENLYRLKQLKETLAPHLEYLRKL